MTESIRADKTSLKHWAGSGVRHHGIDQSERFPWEGGVEGVKGICLEMSAHLKINTTSLLMEVRSCTIPKDTHVRTYIHTHTTAVCCVSFGSICGWKSYAHTLQQSDWARERRQGRMMLLDRMQLQRKHPSSHAQTRTKTHINSIQPAHHYTQEDWYTYRQEMIAYTHRHTVRLGVRECEAGSKLSVTS